MYKLGYTFDIGIGAAPVDFNTAGATGKRVMLRNAQSVNFVCALAVAGGGTDDDVFTLSQHTAASAGTTAALKVDHVWVKAAVALAGTESWTKVAVGVAGVGSGTITLPGATYAADQVIMLVEVNTKDLTDGFDYASLSIADPGAGGTRVGTMLTVLTDLNVRRDPANLQPTLF